jgi:hypothetical protein
MRAEPHHSEARATGKPFNPITLPSGAVHATLQLRMPVQSTSPQCGN